MKSFLDPSLDRVDKVLDFLSRRQEVLSQNVTHATTPGYRTLDVTFQDHLSNEASELRLSRTADGHLALEVDEPELVAAPVPGLEARPDGNNVAMERELLAMTLNRLRFQISIQWASNRLKALRTAIEERGAL